jgi:hypothetical protein
MRPWHRSFLRSLSGIASASLRLNKSGEEQSHDLSGFKPGGLSRQEDYGSLINLVVSIVSFLGSGRKGVS